MINFKEKYYKKKYDAIIIGSGQGGNPLAIKLARAGWKVLLAEAHLLGGSCINRGCIPSKAIIASANAVAQITKSKQLGINVSKVQPKFSAIMKRKNEVVNIFHDANKNNLESEKNIDIVMGQASFINNSTIKINCGSKTIIAEGKNIIINTGAITVIPDIPGLSAISYLTSTDLLQLKHLPEHLIIIGAGYISLETAQAFSRFGAAVTIIEMKNTILENEEPETANTVNEIFKKEKINIITGAAISQVKRIANHKTQVTYIINEKAQRITGSHLLIATGRKANITHLGLENTSIKLNKNGAIKTDSQLRTTVSNVFAIGDAKGGPAFTHVSVHDYKIVLEHLLTGKRTSIARRIIPYCIFIDPEFARAGITEKEAKEKGIDYGIAFLPMNRALKAIVDNTQTGFMKVVVNMKTSKILGASFLCPDAGAILTIVLIAMEAGLPYQKFITQMIPHPILAESLNTLFSRVNRPE